MTCARRFMTPAEVFAARPAPPPPPGADRLALARARMEEAGSWHPRQPIGRRFPIGCVALEITQRCNLDCSLCYLSEHAEAVHDIPLEEVFRRIRLIRAHYGPGTEVQVTGGDPTLRRREELVAIVRAVAAAGMRASLFTNGIRATRDLLAELAVAGLTDVAFHVDMTQGRRGYASEAALNAVREAYIGRARGLPLAVVFNTTVFDGNAQEVPDLARFFLRHAASVNLASFQLQAETGRGVLGARGSPITKDSIAAALSAGVGTLLAFDTIAVGHSGCNRYALMLVADGRAHDLLDDPAVAARVLHAIRDARIDRTRPWRRAAAILGAVAARPGAALAVLPWAARKAWAMRRDLASARGRVAKLTFFIHDFMDARRLEPERIAGCSFMAMTSDGPMAMCLHNARRDEILLRPVPLEAGGWWDPLTGRRSGEAPAPRTPSPAGPKTAKGRRRLEIRHGAPASG
jgi:7,8-dihydro-6-hydroxymethylpterin dimethyltransferase